MLEEVGEARLARLDLVAAADGDGDLERHHVGLAGGHGEHAQPVAEHALVDGVREDAALRHRLGDGALGRGTLGGGGRHQVRQGEGEEQEEAQSPRAGAAQGGLKEGTYGHLWAWR